MICRKIRTGLSRSTIYRKIAEGTFPAQLRISTNGAGWREPTSTAGSLIPLDGDRKAKPMRPAKDGAPTGPEHGKMDNGSSRTKRLPTA